MTRIFWWVLINSTLVYCLYEGVFNGNAGAGRILIFVTWWSALLGWVVALGSASNSELKARILERGRTVPAWLSHSLGAAVVCVLIYHGWWWTGLAMALNELAEAGVYHDSK